MTIQKTLDGEIRNGADCLPAPDSAKPLQIHLRHVSTVLSQIRRVHYEFSAPLPVVNIFTTSIDLWTSSLNFVTTSIGILATALDFCTGCISTRCV